TAASHHIMMGLPARHYPPCLRNPSQSPQVRQLMRSRSSNCSNTFALVIFFRLSLRGNSIYLATARLSPIVNSSAATHHPIYFSCVVVHLSYLEHHQNLL